MGEEELDKAKLMSHSPGIQQHTAYPPLASFQKTAQSSESYQTPVFSLGKIKVMEPESESEWTEGSDMEEISPAQLQKPTDRNGNVTTISSSKIFI